MIQIYYGFGKGKTTAALGLGMRGVGAGKDVLLVQFLKDNKSSELSVLPFDIYPAPDKLAFNPEKENYMPWINNALEYVKNSESDIIILDEFLDAVPDYVSESDAKSLFKSLDLSEKEIVITGHKKIDFLFDSADYITHFEKIKHPFDLGIQARKGIEY